MFQHYAQAYDALYQDKDYEGECDFVQAAADRYLDHRASTILDLGCGTGGHAIPFAQRGFHVIGLDQSAEMIERAQRKRSTLNGHTDYVRFQVGDACRTDLATNFDLVTCMFAVLSYQTTDADALALFKNARRHLDSGGLFICDYWHGPGVLTQRPITRTKTAEFAGDVISRTSTPTLDETKHTVSLDIVTSHAHDGLRFDESREQHRVRYFFASEITRLLTAAGLRPLHFCAFPNLDQPPTANDWNAAVIARAN
ncbi:MAG: hypothetical protein RL514_1625 [Verrucomicrobiota bacterium]|jgi:SAM-dependent methyltransferase